MTLELSDDFLLDEEIEVSFAELTELSGLSETELLELVESGVLVPNNPFKTPWTFSGHHLVIVRSVSRLRDDFELDPSALPLAFLMLDRIRQLETELRTLQAQTPRFP